jgi:two-component system sensor histidine kinase VicK
MIQIQQDLLSSIEHIANLGSYQVNFEQDRWTGSDNLKRIFGLPDQNDFSIAEFYDFIHPDDRTKVRNHVRECTRKRTDFNMEYRCIAAGGQHIYVKSFSRIYYDPLSEAPVQAMGIIQDITEQKSKELQLKELNTLIERKNEMLGMVAHDLLTPIAIFDVYASLLEEDLDGESLGLLQKQREACATTKRIAEDIIELSNLKRSAFILQPIRFILRDLISDSVQQFTYLLEKKKIKVRIYCPTHLQVTWDRKKMARLIDNLLSNAIKFSHPETRITIEVKPSTLDDCIYLSVADQGIGLTDDQIPYLFQQYSTNLRREGTHGEHSTGLGLSIVKEVVNMHKGTISVQSEVNRGTTFEITIQQHLQADLTLSA